ncbi:MAG: adenosylcobinamide-phosphate synthase CbiB [Gammaproteobacteria bacterium]|nr:adenosylcobinamide-phosphate synthase CbiB [Gammaproteobacteria bacterium]
MLIVLLCALLLDYFFGEPVKYHPLVAFGQLANWLEERLNETLINIHSESKVEFSSEFIIEATNDSGSSSTKASNQNRLNGLIAVLICIMPAGWLTYAVVDEGIIGFVLEVIILYFAIGLSSLKQHAQEVLIPLVERQYEQARQALSKIVSRDTEDMDEEGICRAATESVLENGNDAVFATIFWFAVAGAPGVVIFRLTNTLDAMWGYKTERFNSFGFFAAKFDDILNYIPARLTAVTYALMGNWKNAMQCWTIQGSLWESPNSGVVMAAGAGALDVQLGGADQYHGEYKERPDLGCGQKAKPEVIQQACDLLDRSTIVWVVIIALITIPSWI